MVAFMVVLIECVRMQVDETDDDAEDDYHYWNGVYEHSGDEDVGYDDATVDDGVFVFVDVLRGWR